ncbi:SDR family NAD(P)-dependent oxidoreductase [Sphingobium sp. CR2-8]|uniref:SDR family NAD(P)-dependent oxidoreductase n=1 Tax=Sphingobium sp. CR2-8 TaxID=1306534 RepID=UPI002DBF4699|nr:SDR family NAD(P)-dependent oxidoreductase [Sphingobium sp. CR2-8]MEC3911876.1 SDR family NAD(P)-dependent oxidoreductase [Sphingobium sp. CR2-8]
MGIDLQDKVAVITGAGAGLGREYAHYFARLGAKVVVNDLGVSLQGSGENHSAADQVVDEITAQGGVAVANYDNVANPASAAAIVETAMSTFGKIDIVVNNAGILRDSSFPKMTAENFADVLAVHLFGAFYLTHAAWPHMVAQKYGRIIFTTSPAGTNGNFGQANYGAAKLGLVGMMNCLALEGRKHNVLVNAISPSAMTRMTEGIPIGDLAQWLRADLVSPAVAWLASERCSKTAMIISAGGGFFAQHRIFETPGVQFDPIDPVTIDMFDEAFPRIVSTEGAKPVKPGPLGDLVPRLTAMGRLSDV